MQSSLKSLSKKLRAVFNERQSMSDVYVTKVIRLMRPRQFDIVDCELDVRWYPGWLDRAEIYALTRRALELVRH
jgi:hypothetical protein